MSEPLRRGRRRSVRRRVRGALGPVVVASVVLVAVGACRASTDEGSIDRERYISLYVEILRARAAARDPTAAAESAAAVLANRGVTEDDLEQFARRHADDPSYIANVWAEIERRLREPQRSDTSTGE